MHDDLTYGYFDFQSVTFSPRVILDSSVFPIVRTIHYACISSSLSGQRQHQLGSASIRLSKHLPSLVVTSALIIHDLYGLLSIVYASLLLDCFTPLITLSFDDSTSSAYDNYLLWTSQIWRVSCIRQDFFCFSFQPIWSRAVADTLSTPFRMASSSLKVVPENGKNTVCVSQVHWCQNSTIEPEFESIATCGKKTVWRIVQCCCQGLARGTKEHVDQSFRR